MAIGVKPRRLFYSSKLRHLISRRSPTTETQQPIDRKWSVKPILRSIQIYAGIALRFDRKSDLRRAMKPGPVISALWSLSALPTPYPLPFRNGALIEIQSVLVFFLFSFSRWFSKAREIAVTHFILPGTHCRCLDVWQTHAEDITIN